MNRRGFIQSLAAVLSLPANPLLSLRPAAAAIPAAVEVPGHIKSWAVYMSNLHGECTPLALQRLLHIPEADAKTYVGRLIADGVLRPGPLLRESMRKFVNRGQDDFLDGFEEPLELDGELQPQSVAIENAESRHPADGVVSEEDLPEAAADADQTDASVEEAEARQYPSRSPLIT